MRTFKLAGLASAIVTCAVMLAGQSSAMAFVHSPLSARSEVEQVRNVCGLNGCAPVLVKRLRVPLRKFTTTAAAPLVVSGTPAAAPAQPSFPSLPSLASAPWPLSLLQGK